VRESQGREAQLISNNYVDQAIFEQTKGNEGMAYIDVMSVADKEFLAKLTAIVEEARGESFQV
jgi:hypothetical protein